ncbi:hypothetical protein ZYGR_0I06530 [Zygosaccharomyces rouxii]|uniref:ZYRO0C15510p n=2 Tax=Zygosaccharomyces rouxii TaxID=4956 RepID=C5DUB8_ZYGRC|nr:uncharacterized protein ZYRO0C15510g [Zygosaccharomyces rouxii]KAH9201448.1 hypothetical protein LQ764DRAFT_79003 [Zygosaccharomyces rouxii]GAV48356.1 hypothetical protein ZYGR_0I06530 [Zygosaccharomyces rouxii]CAR27379.1 ZYRO0C15510p [Zygosaccharomyces rouxii]
MSSLPVTQDDYNAASFKAPTPRQVLRVALNLKFLIDKVIPIDYDINQVTCQHSRILNHQVIQLTREACGGNRNDKESLRKYQSVLLFALLKVSGWYNELSVKELHNTELYKLRSIAAQHLCKIIIEFEENVDLHYLFLQMLLHRYSMNENDVDSEPLSVVELAADMHATIVIGSSGFQRCISWLWRGWIIQAPDEPTTFVRDATISSMSFKDHFSPERIKTPKYQNILQISFSILFLILYTLVVNEKDSTHVEPFDLAEVIFYCFTLGNLIDEAVKIYYIGFAYLAFWNVFNDTLYTIIGVSFVLRVVSLGLVSTKYSAESWDMLSYRILSCAAPFVWSRLLLYLESVQFVGLMLVVLKFMMTESIVFFVMLLLIMIGFLQGFIGLDASDGNIEIAGPIMRNLVMTVVGAGGFDTFKSFAPPYAAILWYFYCFIVTVILLNILIALYSNAYQKVVENASDEYMALMCEKTLRFIRAPDEYVFVPPLNIIELALKPLEYIISEKNSDRLTHFIMCAIYSPTLLIVAILEVRTAKRIQYNRMTKLQDDANESDEVWDLTDGFVDNGSNLFFDENNDGIHDTRVKNSRALKKQIEAERADPHFPVSPEWHKKVKKSVQPVQEGFQTGVGWELFDLYNQAETRYKKSENKVDELTQAVNELVTLVKELKMKQE